MTAERKTMKVLTKDYDDFINYLREGFEKDYPALNVNRLSFSYLFGCYVDAVVRKNI